MQSHSILENTFYIYVHTNKLTCTAAYLHILVYTMHILENTFYMCTYRTTTNWHALQHTCTTTPCRNDKKACSYEKRDLLIRPKEFFILTCVCVCARALSLLQFAQSHHWGFPFTPPVFPENATGRDIWLRTPHAKRHRHTYTHT